jgi:hypothetical protein
VTLARALSIKGTATQHEQDILSGGHVQPATRRRRENALERRNVARQMCNKPVSCDCFLDAIEMRRGGSSGNPSAWYSQVCKTCMKWGSCHAHNLILLLLRMCAATLQLPCQQSDSTNGQNGCSHAVLHRHWAALARPVQAAELNGRCTKPNAPKRLLSDVLWTVSQYRIVAWASSCSCTAMFSGSSRGACPSCTTNRRHQQDLQCYLSPHSVQMLLCTRCEYNVLYRTRCTAGSRSSSVPAPGMHWMSDGTITRLHAYLLRDSQGICNDHTYSCILCIFSKKWIPQLSLRHTNSQFNLKWIPQLSLKQSTAKYGLKWIPQLSLCYTNSHFNLPCENLHTAGISQIS